MTYEKNKREVHGFLNAEGLLRFIRIFAKDCDLSVELEDDKFMPRMDGRSKTIFLPSPDPYMDEGQEKLYRGVVCHECLHGHPDYRDAFKILEEKRPIPGSKLAFTINLLEDYRIEHSSNGFYKGADQGLSYTQGWACDKIDNPEKTKPASKDEQFCHDLFAWYYQLRSRWQFDVTRSADKWLEDADISWLDKYREELEALGPGMHNEMYDLALRIVAEDEDKSESQVEQEQTDQDGSSGGEGDEERESEGQCPAVVKYSDLLADPHSADDGTPGMVEIIYDTNGNYRPGGIIHIKPWLSRGDGNPNAIRKLLQSGGNLEGQLRRELQTRAQARYRSGHKRGRVASRTLYRARAENDRLFKRKEEQLTLNTAVSLLVDASGSMASNSRHSYATAAAILLHRALAANKIAHEINAFSDTYQSSSDDRILHEIKGWNENPSEDKIIERSCKVDFGNNSDGEYILYCVNQLYAREEARKVLIVLSDGMPSGSHHRGDVSQYTKDVIARHHNRYGVEIYGIGIQTESVKRFYPDFCVINEVNELPRALLGVLRAKLL